MMTEIKNKRNGVWQLIMNLSEAKEGTVYVVKDISTDDAELNVFLFSLGCYSGEPVT